VPVSSRFRSCQLASLSLPLVKQLLRAPPGIVNLGKIMLVQGELVQLSKIEGLALPSLLTIDILGSKASNGVSLTQKQGA